MSFSRCFFVSPKTNTTTTPQATKTPQRKPDPNQPQKSALEEHKRSRRAASSESHSGVNGSFRALRFAGRSLGLPEDVLLLEQTLTYGCHRTCQPRSTAGLGVRSSAGSRRARTPGSAALLRRNAAQKEARWGSRAGFRALGARARSGSRFCWRGLWRPRSGGSGAGLEGAAGERINRTLFCAGSRDSGLFLSSRASSWCQTLCPVQTPDVPVLPPHVENTNTTISSLGNNCEKC